MNELHIRVSEEGKPDFGFDVRTNLRGLKLAEVIWDAVKNKNEDNEVIDVLNKLRLSMKAHPGYQTGRNQEFVDYVQKAEKVLRQTEKI